MILLHTLPALLDLLMSETKRSRYLYTDQANFSCSKRKKTCLFIFIPPFYPISQFLHVTGDLDMDMVARIKF